MSLGLLALAVVVAVVAGLFVGNVAARQLEAAEEEKQSIGKRARKAATKGVVSWLLRRRRDDD
jgi:hypothetical protein